MMIYAKSLLCGKMKFCGFAFHAFVLSTLWIPAVCLSSVIPAGIWGDSPEGQTFCCCHLPINFRLSWSQKDSTTLYREFFWKYKMKIRWQTFFLKLLWLLLPFLRVVSPAKRLLCSQTWHKCLCTILWKAAGMPAWDHFCKINICLAQKLHCLRVCQGFIVGSFTAREQDRGHAGHIQIE